MKRIDLSCWSLGIAVSLVYCGQASGVAIVQSSSFLPGPINLTFDDTGEAMLPRYTDVSTQFQPQGVNFYGFDGIKYDTDGTTFNPPNISGNYLANFNPGNSASNPSYILFVDPTTGLSDVVTSAAFP